MLQTVFTKIVLHTKLLISSLLLSVTSSLGYTNKSTDMKPTISPTTNSVAIQVASKSTELSKPTATPSYSDLHCPKIIGINDTIGNSKTNITSFFKKREINTLKLTVTAQDPNGLPLYYRFDSLGLENTDQRSVTSKDWSQENFVEIDTSNAVLGTRRYISVYIDNRDGYSCYGSYDIYTTAFYDVVP